VSQNEKKTMMTMAWYISYMNATKNRRQSRRQSRAKLLIPGITILNTNDI
jgi:hypothetical protein